MTAREPGQRLPYPGLRPFSHDETDLFFGREHSVNDMLRRLARSRFLAVLGASGSGKSSLVRTGLLDGLELGLMAEAGSWWRIVELRPGASPIRSLARALCGEGAGADEVEQMRAFLLRGPRSIEIWSRENLQSGENLLILVDQFEELFRYQHYEGHQEAEAFVSLLLESARNRAAPAHVPAHVPTYVPTYVTVTMRSEFLGACALFGGLAEAMNDGQYLTPRLGREQCQMAIEGPAGVCGFEIEPALVGRLLNDLSEFAPWETQGASGLRTQLDQIIRRADQLPLLQHVLNRLWIRATAEDGPCVLRLADYLAIGGLRGAIDQHIAEIAATLEPRQREGIRPLFRALTTGATLADAVRRPTTLAELVEVTGLARDDLIAVCEAFRSKGRNFLTPFPPVPLTDSTIIDISHESLIRQWTDLTQWLVEEANDAAELRRLDEAAKRAETDRGDLIVGRELAGRASWYREFRPREAWAARYVANSQAAFDFLERSIAADRGRRGRAWLGRLAVVVLVLAVVGAVGLWRGQMISNSEILAAQNQLSLRNKELIRIRDQLSDARTNLRTTLAETISAVQNYIAGPIDKLQRDQRYAASSDLLGALIEQTLSIDQLPLSIIDRMAWQAAVDSAAPYTVDGFGAGTLMEQIDPDRRGAFALWRDRDASGTISVVDRRDGSTLDQFAFDTDAIGSPESFALSADGTQALMRGEDGRLYRWASGDAAARRVLDRRWLSGQGKSAASDRRVYSVAFDPERESIGVLYRAYDTAFLMLIPSREAWRAPSWPLYDIVAAIAAQMPAGETPVISSDDLLLVALDSDDAIFAFVNRVSDPGIDERGLVRFHLGNGTAEILVQPGLLRTARETTEAHVLHLTLRTARADCNADRLDLRAGSLGEPPFGNSCYADFDLRTGKLAGPALILPSNLESDLRPLADSQADTSLKAADRTRFGGDGLPLFEVTARPAAEDAGQDRTELTWWAANENPFFLRDRDAPRQALVTDDGFVVSQASEDVWLSRSDMFDPTLPGATLAQDSYRLDHAFTTAPTAVMDGAGTLLLAKADGGWWTQPYPRGGAWQPLPIAAAADCGAEIAGEPNQEGTPGERDDARPPVRLAADAQPLQAASLTRQDFLVRIGDARIGLLALRPQKGGLAGRLFCLERSAATRVLDVDVATGTVALTDETSRVIFVTSFPADGESPALERRIDLSDPVTAAQFMSGARLAALTKADGLMIYDLAGEPRLMSRQIAFLPLAQEIRTRGNLVLLVRDEGSPAEWSSAALAEVAPSTGGHRLLRVGMLPLDLGRIGMMRIADDAGTVEAMTSNYLLRFRLPRVAATSDLVHIVRAMSDPASGEQSDSSARLLSLASSAIQPGREGAAGDPYFACAGAIEAELSRWPRAMAASRYELDRIASGCATAGSQWPTPAAIADLLAISPASSDAWPEPASRLLELARGGDSLALRALLLWSQAQTRPSLAAIATDSLIKRLFGAPGGRRFEALPPGLLAYATAAASSADPMTHRLLGQAAERQGSATALTSAFFHYGAAEAIYRAAGDDTEASLLRDWRIAVANRLSQEERAQAMARLEAWTPVVPAMKDRPAAGPDRLASDAATLDQLAESLGGGAELDLLKLHILRLRLALAPAADRMALAQRISALILSRDIWPAGANRDGGLAQLAEQAAEALPAADADQRLKLNLAIIRIFETDGAIIDFDQAGRPGDPTAIYRRALTSAVAAGRDRLAAVSGEFRFGTRAFSFRSVRYSYGPASVAAETALWLRLELAKALPDRPDVLAARAVTPFWIAVNLTDTQTQRDFLRGGDYDAVQRWYDDSLDQSFYGLADLERGGPLSHDDLAVLASAISWIANTIPNARIAEDIETFDLALRAVDRLEAQIEEGQPLPPWGRELSAHIDGLGLVATALSGLGADEPAFDADPPVSYRPMMQALGLAAQWEGLMLRGASTIADDDDLTQLPIPGTGIAIGFVAGRERNQPAKAAAAGDCERTASAYFDPERRAPAVSYDTVANDPVAVSNCLSAVQAAPEDPKLRFLLGRALNAEHAALGYAGDSPDAVRQFAAAAEAGYAAAFHNLAYIETDYQSSLLEGYVQRVLQTAFADAFKGFLTLPASDRDDSALFWFARRAADLGSPEANQILADLEPDPAERKFRLLIAARLWREARNPASEAAARDSAANIALAGEAEALVEAKAAAWTAEPLAELAPEMLTAIDGLGRP